MKSKSTKTFMKSERVREIMMNKLTSSVDAKAISNLKQLITHSPTYSLSVGGAITSKNENRNLRERMIKSENLTEILIKLL